MIDPSAPSLVLSPLQCATRPSGVRRRSVALLVACVAAASGCTTRPIGSATAIDPSVFADALFNAPTEAIDDDVFAVSDSMRLFLDQTFRFNARLKGSRQALVDALTHDAQLKLSYDATHTRNAAQAFDERIGNCLSLVILTAAFADALGLPVEFNSVQVDDEWTRVDGVYYASAHVNISLARGSYAERLGYDAAALMTIDFLSATELRGRRTRKISRDTIVSMYLNNRAAEHIAKNDLVHAYWWARRAAQLLPASPTAFNTLGVVYLRRGATNQAETSLRHALSLEPDNTKVLHNLALVLEQTGRAQLATVHRTRLATLERIPPYHHHDLGMTALRLGDYAAARDHFERELARASGHHEFHFALALAYHGLGDGANVKRHLDLAHRNSPTDRQRSVYARKLDGLVRPKVL